MNETTTPSETPLLSEFFPDMVETLPTEVALKCESNFDKTTTEIARVFTDIFVDNLRGRMKARKLAGVAV